MVEYITISEFAKRANVSRQSIYKKIDKCLQNKVNKAFGEDLYHEKKQKFVI